MKLAELIQYRRSIRKYTQQQVPKEDLEAVMQAGLYAPSAGGGQRNIIVAIRDRELCEKIGKINVACMDRSKLAGVYVSKDQPSIIDDPKIKSGFYGAPTVCAIFAPKGFLYSLPDAFCSAENMVLMATELGLASCIIGRGEETFANDFGRELMQSWQLPENYTACCFVLLGYCNGDYPTVKARKTGRSLIIE